MPTGTDLIDAARTYLGAPYEYGGKTVAGLDCSGLISLACADLGVSIPHGSAAQIGACTPITVEAARSIPGALLYRVGHDGLSTGTGVVEARTPRVVEGTWTTTYDSGRTRWTHAGLIPGITYPEEAAVAAPIRLIYPLAGGRVTSGYSRRRVHPVTGVVTAHLGADIGDGQGYGRPVLAPTSGRVTAVVTGRRAGQPATTGTILAPGRSGNGILIRGAAGTVLLGHVAPIVRVGEIVEAGVVVGHTDPSGIQSGAHVHTEWWPTGSPASATDPAPYLVRPTAGIGTTPTAPAVPTAPAPVSPPQPFQEDDMAESRIQIQGRPEVYYVNTATGAFEHIVSPEENGLLTVSGVRAVRIVNQREKDVLAAFCGRVRATLRKG